MKRLFNNIISNLLPIYIITNIIYMIIGSFIFNRNYMYIKNFSYGYIFFLVINIFIILISFFRKKYNKNNIDILLLLIVIFSIISTIFAYSPKKALFGEWGRCEGLFTICYYMSILYLCSCLSSKQKKYIIFSIFVYGLIQCFYGIFQSLGLFNVKIIIHFGVLVIKGLTTNPNFFGTLMFLCLGYTIGLFLYSKDKLFSVTTIILSYIFLIGLLLSDALSSFVGLLFVLFILLIYSIKNKLIKKYIIILIVVSSTIFLIDKMEMTLLVDDLIKAKNEATDIAKGNLNDDYGTGRVKIWKETIKIVPKYIIHGVGVDNFAHVLDSKPIKRNNNYYDKAHNEYLQILVTTGIFNLISYLLLFLLVLKNAYKNKIYYFIPIVGYLTQAFFNISVIEVAPIFYMTMGLSVNRDNNYSIYSYLKRFLDILLSIVLLVILFVPSLIIVLLILLVDGNNPIFIQERTGKNGKIFKLFKFRTMKNGKITKVGKLIRKLSFDEVPQVINIIKGDMSFIGPRAWIISYYNYMNEEERRRNNVLPGITGLAQVNGRNNISIFKKIEYDLYYVDNYSIKLDLYILLKTIPTILKGDNSINEKGINKEIEKLKNR